MAFPEGLTSYFNFLEQHWIKYVTFKNSYRKTEYCEGCANSMEILNINRMKIEYIRNGNFKARACRHCKEEVYKEICSFGETLSLEMAIGNLQQQDNPGEVTKIIIEKKPIGQSQAWAVKPQKAEEPCTSSAGQVTHEPVYASNLSDMEVKNVLDEILSEPENRPQEIEDLEVERKRVKIEEVICPVSPFLPTGSNEILGWNSRDETDGDNNYEDETARVHSFLGWKCPFFTPTAMARAGFYYTGEMDRVKCFACEVELHRWDSTDCPRKEHERWGKDCPFLKENQPGNRQSGNPQVGEDTCGRFVDTYGGKGIEEERAKVCKVCFIKRVNTLFFPCGHILACQDCAVQVEYCPICRSYIQIKTNVILL